MRKKVLFFLSAETVQCWGPGGKSDPHSCVSWLWFPDTGLPHRKHVPDTDNWTVPGGSTQGVKG